jgi:hypothetical protein
MEMIRHPPNRHAGSEPEPISAWRLLETRKGSFAILSAAAGVDYCQSMAK